VIEQLVDLLGHSPRMFFEITKAPTGVLSFEFGQVPCALAVAPVRIASCAENPEQPAVEGKRSSIDMDDQPWPLVVKHLQLIEHIPVSFIEELPVQRITVHARDLPPRLLLEQLVSSAPGLRCLSANGHLVIAPSNDALKERLEGVQITMSNPWYAAISLAQLLHKTPGFLDLVPWVEPPTDPMLRKVEISLAPHGNVLDFLVQVLGDNPRAYFTIEKLPSGKRTLALASVQ
jgi:hypothetical protein